MKKLLFSMVLLAGLTASYLVAAPDHRVNWHKVRDALVSGGTAIQPASPSGLTITTGSVYWVTISESNTIFNFNIPEGPLWDLKVFYNGQWYDPPTRWYGGTGFGISADIVPVIFEFTR